MHSLRIGELAERTDCQVETIRYYEKEGLLPVPARSEGNYRLYSDVHVDRLMFIRHCRSLDMALDEIRRLLQFRDAPEQNCGEVNVLLDEHIGHVAARIAELKRLEKQLKMLRRLCDQAQEAKNCRILNELSTDLSGMMPAKRPAKKLHVEHVHGPRTRTK
ncbi:MAG TPA: Cd(II)/Pb(II)-responsive transcriptional regulator [Noviherbaspirillum sp.]|nr:Cd(II)/Pb(II)-responsive transcriptional regulator [Noviherbaspirillum sp.]